MHLMLKDLVGDEIAAKDGKIGSVRDVYFDDERWGVRYLVVDTGNWLPGRQVLISPASLKHDGVGDGAIHADLTRRQIEESPSSDKDRPVSRLYEEAHATYYGYPYYWGGPYMWGIAATPGAFPYLGRPPESIREDERVRSEVEQKARESHLRARSEVSGYSIEAADGPLGHVEDFVVDDETWAVVDMVVDTRNWLPGKKVLVPPDAIRDIDWHGKQVRVGMKRDELRGAPEAP